MQNHYLPNDTWKALSAALVEAARHPLDPRTAIEIGLAAAGIMPEMCRDDFEVTKNS